MFNTGEFKVGVGMFLALLLTILIYIPGLPGMFLVDDVWNLSQLNLHGGVVDWNSFKAFVFGNSSGPLGRPVSMLSFLINDQYYPGDVRSFRYTNLMLHGLCGLFFFIISRQILAFLSGEATQKNDYVALVAMLWWLVNPFNVSTTLYVVQRMTQLSTLFSLVGLFLYLYGRKRVLSDGLRGYFCVVLGLYGFGLIAVLSKESGALIFLYAAAIEFALVMSGSKSDRGVWSLILSPLLVGLAYFIVNWGGYTGSSYRSFTVYERVLTESRILWDYLYKIVFPVLGKSGLIHDDILVSKGFFNPITTFFAVASHCILLIVCWLLRRRYTLLLLAVLWFYFGHALESTVFSLELYFEHRNYMPSMLVILAICFYVFNAVKMREVASCVLFTLIILSIVVCFQRTALWGKPVLLIKTWAFEHPNSIRAQSMNVRYLFKARLYDETSDKLANLRVKWPNVVHFDLLYLNHLCRGNVVGNFNKEEFLRRMDVGEFHGSFSSVLENTLELYESSSCNLIDADLMHKILSRVDGLKYVIGKMKAKAAYWDMSIYVEQGDLAGALAAVDKAFLYQRDSYILFTKSKILFSAGLYDMALSELDRAIELERSVVPHKRKWMGKYTESREMALETINRMDGLSNGN